MGTPVPTEGEPETGVADREAEAEDGGICTELIGIGRVTVGGVTIEMLMLIDPIGEMLGRPGPDADAELAGLDDAGTLDPG